MSACDHRYVFDALAEIAVSFVAVRVAGLRARRRLTREGRLTCAIRAETSRSEQANADWRYGDAQLRQHRFVFHESTVGAEAEAFEVLEVDATDPLNSLRHGYVVVRLVTTSGTFAWDLPRGVLEEAQALLNFSEV